MIAANDSELPGQADRAIRPRCIYPGGAFQGFEQQAERRLAILNAAPSLNTLRDLPSNRFEALRGDRSGRFSIRINQQWRICFEWPDRQPGPGNVEIVDYH